MIFLPRLHLKADCDDDAIVAKASLVAQKTAEVPQARHAAVLQSARWRQASKGRDSVAVLGLVSPCNLGLRIFAPEAIGRRDVQWFDVLAGYGYGFDVSVVYLISVRLSSSHLSNGSIRVLGGSTTMSSHWKQVHTVFRSTEDRCCRTGSNTCLSVHRVRFSVASRNEFHRSSEVLKTMEVPQRSRWKLTGVSEMRLATLLLLLSRPSPSLRVWTMVCVRTETAARNPRPAVFQDMGVLVVTSWDE